MRFDREPWRKLYVAESAEHLFMALASRGLRDYLLRFASEDGTLLPKTSDPVGDLAYVLRAKPTERKLVADVLADLQKVGYLRLERGRLWITRFEDGQKARSAGAKRQAAYKARHQTPSPETSPGDVTESVTADVTADTMGDVTKEEKRRDETTTPKPPRGVVVVDLEVPCPADLSLIPAQIATLTTALVPEAAITGLTKRFIGSYQADERDKRTLVAWRKCLSQAISGWWNDPRTKAQYLNQAKASGDDTGGYGPADSWES
jgi:hypothetical protein